MKSYLLALSVLIFTLPVFSNDTCMDVAALSQMIKLKPLEEQKNVELKKIIDLYNLKIKTQLKLGFDRAEAAGVKLGQAPFKIRWKFNTNGKIEARCDCEEILNLSSDIISAREVLKILKTSVSAINLMDLQQIELKPGTQRLEFCASGVFTGSKANPESPKSSNTSLGTVN